MGLTQRLLQILPAFAPLAPAGTELMRADPTITVGQYAQMLNPWDFTTLNWGGSIYPASSLNQTAPGSKQEEIDGGFEGFVRQAYKTNGVIFACIAAHIRLFSEGRFQFQRLTDGRPGDLFGNASLEILETPWPNATTGDLLARMIQDADLAGNFFAVNRGRRIKRMRPDWVTIVLGSMESPNVTSIDLDADVLGYIYWPGGRRAGNRPVPLHVDEVCHFAPLPDPVANYRGMSWLTPLVREIMADSAATAHKLTFFENGATPNLIVKRPDSPDKNAFELWKEMMEEGHRGVANAYKTLYMTAGADATVVGGNMQQLDFKVVQGAGETRIAAAAGVPPIIVGLSEGLSAATYSNYGQARRAYADLWARPNWRSAAGALQTIVPAPKATRLWIDARDIQFLAEDQKDAAAIQSVNALTIKALIDTGFKADAAIQAVENGDMGFLTGQHTGLFSVQLQAPGSTKMPGGETAGDLPVGDSKGPSKATVAKQIPAKTGGASANPPSARYSELEARKPKGVPGGGQWTTGGMVTGTGILDKNAAEIKLRAAELAAQAAAVEPAITADMQGIAAKTGGELAGLAFRLKTEESLARKLASDPQYVADGKTLDERVAAIKDSIRYTVLLPEGQYHAGVVDGIHAAQAAGYTAKVKNVWVDAQAGYAGFHASLAKEGQPVVELQFHTAKTFALKEIGEPARGIPPSHVLYEALRLARTPAESARIQRQIDAVWAPIRQMAPAGVYTSPPPPVVFSPSS